MNNYINLNEKEISKPIYRIISFERLLKIFQSKQITLVKPEKWGDPFENIIARAEIITQSNIMKIGIRDNPHGICWTQKSESDAIWRIYSSDKKCIRIESTPEIICNNILKGLQKYKNSRLFIGKVEYIPENKIKGKVKKISKKSLKSDQNEIIAESLLFKRDSFLHEDEVRVIVIDQDNLSIDGIINIDINPHELIKSIQIDSRAPNEIIDVYRTYLIDKLNFKGLINKSTLYDVQKPIIARLKVKNKKIKHK